MGGASNFFNSAAEAADTIGNGFRGVAMQAAKPEGALEKWFLDLLTDDQEQRLLLRGEATRFQNVSPTLLWNRVKDDSRSDESRASSVASYGVYLARSADQDPVKAVAVVALFALAVMAMAVAVKIAAPVIAAGLLAYVAANYLTEKSDKRVSFKQS